MLLGAEKVVCFELLCQYLTKLWCLCFGLIGGRLFRIDSDK